MPCFGSAGTDNFATLNERLPLREGAEQRLYSVLQMYAKYVTLHSR